MHETGCHSCKNKFSAGDAEGLQASGAKYRQPVPACKVQLLYSMKIFIFLHSSLLHQAASLSPLLEPLGEASSSCFKAKQARNSRNILTGSWWYQTCTCALRSAAWLACLCIRHQIDFLMQRCSTQCARIQKMVFLESASRQQLFTTFHDFSRLRFASMSIQCLFAIWCFLVLLFRDQVFVFILEIQSQQFIALSIYPRHGAQLIFVDGGWNNWPSHLHQGHVDESTECASEAQRLSRWRIEDPESSLNSNNTRVGPFLSTATFSCASRGRAILNARHSWYLITTITPCRYLGWSFHILPLIHGFSSACRSVECAWFYFKLVR